MKTLTLEQTHQMLTGIQVANVCTRSFDEQKNSLQKDDPIHVAVELVQEKVQSLCGVNLQVDDETYALMQQIGADISNIQGQIHARKHAH